MRSVLAGASGIGTVVAGEEEKDDAPMLFSGEQLGAGERAFDIAVDPLECTTLCAKGRPGRYRLSPLQARSQLLLQSPSFYIHKLVVPPAARNAIDITDAPRRRSRASRGPSKGDAEPAGGGPDKPRHSELIGRLHERRFGATPSDGDVAGALRGAVARGRGRRVDGHGGTPEGVMTACAAKAVGGGMQARLAPSGPGRGPRAH